MLTRGGRMLPSTRRALFILPLWIASSVWLWGWWLQANRIESSGLFIALTLALLYEFLLLPSVFLYFVLKATYPQTKRAEKGKKVAIITLCVPNSESSDIIEKQLKAMAAIRYPHDSWILDEGKSPEVRRLARQYGVKYFSRRGVRKYNRPLPPFKAKTKAGNVNSWLDRVKRRRYDFFVQLDIDHLPKPNYLDKTLGYFKDEKVAWVQAPSVYKNLEHWTARGSAEQELVLQGPLQMGFYGHSQTPFIIGSHCTYRMKAIQEIGGFQPTRAEDHLDTVVLANHGYTGIFIPEVIAEGDGPETLNTYLAQQFAWAYSMFQVLLFHTPKLLRGMPIKRKLQFLFAQTWYPMWSLSYLVMFCTPMVALFINQNVARMSGEDFLRHFLPIYVMAFGVWWAGRPLMQPKKLRLSWRGVLLHAVRWPIVLRAIISATFKVKKPYMITPKGRFASLAPTLRLYAPFLTLGFLSTFAVIFASNAYGYRSATSQMFFALMNVLFMLVICSVDLNQRLKRETPDREALRELWLKPVLAVASLAVIASITLLSSSLVRRQTLALTVPTQAISARSTKDLPVSELTDKEVLTELSTPAPAPAAAPQLGLYDPNKTITASEPYIRHSFVDWQQPSYLARELLKSKRFGATPLVTLEPKGQTDGNALLLGIAKGDYNAQLDQLSAIINADHTPVYIRFAHEMDLTDLYPWGNQSPETYITAYRYVVNYVRARAPESRWMWSPAGNDGAELYYPGDDVVDVVGTTILYDTYWYGQYQPSFAELADKRLWLKQYNKPLWIAEFGIGRADGAYQQALLHQALSEYKDDGFQALVYLSIADANLSGPDYRLDNISQLNAAVIASQPLPAAVPAPQKATTPPAKVRLPKSPYLGIPLPVK